MSAPTPKLGDLVMVGVPHVRDADYTACISIVTSVEGDGILVACFSSTGSLVPLPASPIQYSATPAPNRWWPR